MSQTCSRVKLGGCNEQKTVPAGYDQGGDHVICPISAFRRQNLDSGLLESVEEVAWNRSGVVYIGELLIF